MKTISMLAYTVTFQNNSVGRDRPLDPPSLCVGAFIDARCSPSGSVALALYKAGAPFGRRCQKGKRRRASEREREREKRSGEETRAGRRYKRRLRCVAVAVREGAVVRVILGHITPYPL